MIRPVTLQAGFLVSLGLLVGAADLGSSTNLIGSLLLITGVMVLLSPVGASMPGLVPVRAKQTRDPRRAGSIRSGQ